MTTSTRIAGSEPADLVRPGAARHWLDGDHFADQCDVPGSRETVAARWRIFDELLGRWLPSGAARARLTALDAGCGDGVNLEPLAHMLAARARRVTLLGLDYSHLRLTRVRSHRRSSRVVQASLTRLPFADGACDVILCNQVLEHLRQPDVAARELARVLSPSGVAIIGVPNEGCLAAQLRNHVLQRSILATTDHVNFFTAPALTHLLAASGLVVRELRTEGLFLPHLRLSGLVRSTRLGRAVVEAAGRVLPGQAAGLIAAVTRTA